jgi:2Fe-2S ferredoxin
MKIVLPMAKILIENLFGKILSVENPEKTLLQHFQDNRLDWMFACGGKGRCTTCKVIVSEGMNNMSPLTVAEQRYRAIRALGLNERLSCQANVSGDITISAPEEYKLPHVHYSN